MRSRPGLGDRPSARRGASEPVIGLINVVFLMLIFFLIAGTIGPPTEPDLRLLRIAGMPGQPPDEALVLTAEGDLRFRQQPTDAASYAAALSEPRVARLMPDRDTPAVRLVEVADALAQAGVERIVILGEPAR